MRRILPVIALVIALGSLCAAAAWARSDEAASVSASAKLAASRVEDPFTVPRSMPMRDAKQPGFVYGYRSGAEIGAELEAAAAADRAGAPAAPAGGSSILVTATVLPGVSVTLSEDGHLAELVVNTDERDLRDVLVVAPRALDAAMWAELRSALLEARAGIGTIWVAE